MSDPYTGYIFIVNLEILFDGIPLKPSNSKRVFHFQKKEYDKWVLTLLKIDESEIDNYFPEIEKENIIRTIFPVQDYAFGIFFQWSIISLTYWRRNEKNFEGEFELCSIINFETPSMADIPEDIKEKSLNIYAPENEEYRNNRLVEEYMFCELDIYLRENEARFFPVHDSNPIKKLTFLSRIKKRIKGIFK